MPAMIEAGGDARLISGPLVPKVLRFGAPLAAAMAFHGLFNCVDLIIVGRLGQGAVAAVTIAGVLNMAAMLVFNGFANMLAAASARLTGQGDRDAVDRLAADSLRLTLLFSLVIGAALFGGARWLVELLGADTETTEVAVRYLRILAVGGTNMFLILWATSLLRGAGESRWPMVSLITANALNIALDILLVFGYWGFPRMGVEGAAWATFFARIVAGAIVIAILVRGRHGVRLRGVMRPSLGDAPSLLVRGLGSSAQLVVRVIAMYGLLVFAAGAARRMLGDEGPRAVVDGLGICIRLEMISVFIGLGWGSAAGALVGQCLGADRPERAVAGTRVACVAASLSGLLVGGAIVVFGDVLLPLLAPGLPQASYDAAGRYLSFTVPAYLPLLTGVVLSQALNGAGSTRVPFVIDLLTHGVILFTTCGILASRGAGLDAFWVTIALCHLLSAVIYGVVFSRSWWQKTAIPGARGSDVQAA